MKKVEAFTSDFSHYFTVFANSCSLRTINICLFKCKFVKFFIPNQKWFGYRLELCNAVVHVYVHSEDSIFLN